MNLRDILRNFDGISFWLGFLAATALWWLLARLRPALARIRVSFQSQSQTTRYQRSLSDEIRLGNDTLRFSQELHLASPLFSLDEILVPPRLLAPAVPPMAYEPPPSQDITDWSIPFMVDYPELASFYKAPSLDPVEALQGGANLAIVGEPGSGKSVALAYIAGQLIRGHARGEAASNRVPLLVHAYDLVLPPKAPQTPLEPLLNAISAYTSSLPTARLPKTVQTAIEQKRAVLLVDGLDELPASQLDEICNYLRLVLRQYPGLQIVVAAMARNLDGLLGMGFIPLPVATWSQEQREAFIVRWSDLWNRFVAASDKGEGANPLLLVGWLLNNTAQYTPMELTLKVWAAFAGDSLGPNPIDALEAYLQRMTYGQPAKNRMGFEQLASQMVLAMRPVAERRIAESWLSGSDVLPAELEAPSAETPSRGKSAPKERPIARGALPELLESGLVLVRSAERVSILHPEVAGYLASLALLPVEGGEQLVNHPDWMGKLSTLRYLAIQDRQANWVEALLKDESADPLLSGLLIASRWLRGAPEKCSWVATVMRQLAMALQNEQFTLRLRARVLSALALSGNAGVAVLLRQMLNSPHSDVRQLAVLGCGVIKDKKVVEALSKLIDEPSAGVSRAALLALVAIGSRESMEAAAYALLHGDDSLRRDAAEALANHPEEGHPTLEEGSALDDPAVRRAVVFGLGRIKQPWTISILEKLRTDDPQWIVQDAASQVLATIQGTNPRLPQPLPSLPQTAWLIAFAAQKGMGVAPGKPAYDLLYQALRSGSEDERMAALYYLSFYGDHGAVLPVYQTYFSSTEEMREAAFDTLWNLAAAGVELPPPAQYGLK
ncbi:MAG: HEAT repeat domain-containing protein [Anaerolineales bacterium]|nr:HEAT repeat domain-containing protein [Anaerolineales bacterium]